MPGISNETRVVFWIIAETGLAIFGILGSVLAINFVYSLSKTGRPPTRRSTLIWIMFSGSFILFIVFGALSNFAPALSNEGDNTLDTVGTPQYSSDSIRLIPIEEQNIVV